MAKSDNFAGVGALLIMNRERTVDQGGCRCGASSKHSDARLLEAMCDALNVGPGDLIERGPTEEEVTPALLLAQLGCLRLRGVAKIEGAVVR